MKMQFFPIHIYFFQIILNILPFFWIDVFYDNYTYLANSGHHFFFVLAWGLSTIFGFYTYAKEIWKFYNIPIHKKRHAIACLGMLVIVFIPYANNGNACLNNLHVWLFILCFSLYVLNWIQTIPYGNHEYQQGLKSLGILLSILLFTFFLIGHMSAFTEILTSVGVNYVLYAWTKNRVLIPHSAH